MHLFDKIQETTSFIKTTFANRNISLPQSLKAGIILGSGLGGLLDDVEVALEIPYQVLPHFPQSTVEGHAGKLVFGKLNGADVVMMAGRFHFYEGYDMQEVTFPVRVMKALDVQTMIVSNAAGGMNEAYGVGDIVLIRDHINLFPEHPLRGANDERLGARFPDMSEPYDLELLEQAKTIAARQNLEVHTGIYTGVQGPTFETRSEYQYMHRIGGDVVGMSTVPEVIVARHGGMRVFGASIVTDIGIREDRNIITHEEVLEAASAAAPKLASLVAELVSEM